MEDRCAVLSGFWGNGIPHAPLPLPSRQSGFGRSSLTRTCAVSLANSSLTRRHFYHTEERQKTRGRRLLLRNVVRVPWIVRSGLRSLTTVRRWWGDELFSFRCLRLAFRRCLILPSSRLRPAQSKRDRRKVPEHVPPESLRCWGQQKKKSAPRLAFAASLVSP